MRLRVQSHELCLPCRWSRSRTCQQLLQDHVPLYNFKALCLAGLICAVPLCTGAAEAAGGHPRRGTTHSLYPTVEPHNRMQATRPCAHCCCTGTASCPTQAFCAGGDVKTAVLQARAGDTGSPMTFFRLEYLNNLAIAQLPRPYIALMDGIVMGGGVGVSYHGSFRVATERYAMARAGKRCIPCPD